MPDPHRYLVKLVRDRVGQNLRKTDIDYAPIEDREEAIRRLRGKLIEEAVEYLLNPSVGELADVLEALEALASHDPALATDGRGALGRSIGMSAVRDEQARKRKERGGFDGLVGMWAFTAGKWP